MRSLPPSADKAHWRRPLESLAQATVVQDPLPWLGTLDPSEMPQALSYTEKLLRDLERPLHPSGWAPAWRTLERCAGWMEFFLHQDGTRALAAERVVWLRGGKDILYLKRMATLGEANAAFDLARSLHAQCANKNRGRAKKLQAFMRGDGLLPAEFLSFLEMVDDTMPLHAMATGLEEAPAPVRPQARFRMAERLDDPARRFEVLCLDGATQDAIALIATGEVPAFVVARRAEQADPSVRGLWLGLAARAALYGGDELGVVRFLRQAFECEDPPLLDREHIWTQATPSLRAHLRRAGLAAESNTEPPM